MLSGAVFLWNSGLSVLFSGPQVKKFEHIEPGELQKSFEWNSPGRGIWRMGISPGPLDREFLIRLGNAKMEIRVQNLSTNTLAVGATAVEGLMSNVVYSGSITNLIENWGIEVYQPEARPSLAKFYFVWETNVTFKSGASIYAEKLESMP